MSTQSDEGFGAHAVSQRAAFAMPQPWHKMSRATADAIYAFQADQSPVFGSALAGSDGSSCGHEPRAQATPRSFRTHARPPEPFWTQVRRAGEAGVAQASRSSGAGSRTKAGRCSSHRSALLCAAGCIPCAHDGVAACCACLHEHARKTKACVTCRKIMRS